MIGFRSISRLRSLSSFLSSRSFSNQSTDFYQIRGKTALVTGGTSGIGLGITRRLANEGVNVVMNGLGDESFLKKLANDLSHQYKVKVILDVSNLSIKEGCQGLARKALSEFGTIDILVNNAGIQFVSSLLEFPDEKWDQIIGINLSSAFHLSKAVLPGMLKKNWGRIINTASVHGLVGSAHKAPYVASKHGLVGFTKATALELATSGVTVNAVCPGWVRTDLVEIQIAARSKQLGISTEAAADDILKEKQPSRQFCTVDQIADAVLYLCSPGANNIRGVSLPVDGGWTAQ